MRLTVMLVFVTVVCGLVYFVFTHPSVDRIEELESELGDLEAQNEELEERNEDLERQITALRDDPRVAERRARESRGMVRPEELIFQFEEDDDPAAVQVPLKVGPERLELAGEILKMAELDARLVELADDLPRAELQVDVEDEVGPIERQRVVDIVEDSPLGPGQWDDEG